ncbi:MAG: TRIC cation channel family protein, partial [Actinomycetota bacterium]
MFASVDTTSGALVVLTVIGTIAFAVSGVMAAAHSAMDWLGALVLAVVVAVGGGTMRDVLIGNLPVMWVDTKWPVVVALGTAVVGIVLLRIRPSLDPTEWRLYLAADAIGLGAFVVLGTRVALDDRASVFIAVLMGVVTGVGGGVIRDVVTGRRPMVLVGQIYAVAGCGGALVYVALDAAG